MSLDANQGPSFAPRIFTIRGEPVVLDADLARLYGVETKALNKALNRNGDRFPRDFAFRLTLKEFTDLRFQIGTSSSHGGRRSVPWVFTEHGAIMVTSILNSLRAVAMSVYVVRAFVRMRREILSNATIEARLQRIEKRLLAHDHGLRDRYQKLKPLLLPPPLPPRKRIGFHADKAP